MSNPNIRIETAKMIDTIRYGIEKFYWKTLTELRGHQYQGTFDVTLKISNKTADQALMSVYTEGGIVFYPAAAEKYASQKRFRENGNGINLTSLSNSPKLDSYLDSDAGETKKAMLSEVFTLPHDHGGLEIQTIITEAQRATGYDAPQIEMNFGG